MGGVISKIHSLKQCGFKTYQKLYDTCVLPILDYSSAVWGYKHFQSSDNVQNRAIRYFLGVHRFTPVIALTGETGWLPSMYRRWIIMLKYWNRLVLLDEDRLTKSAFETDYQHSAYTDNWCSDIKRIMMNLQLTSHFDHQTPVDINTVKERIETYYSARWSADCENTPKLRTYRTFKSHRSIKCEDYLMLDLTRNERAVYAQFRCGVLPLRVETGRYVGEAPDERLCTMCDAQAVEDETHFLTNCAMYQTIRETVFGDILDTQLYKDLSNAQRLTYLITNFNRKVAKFIVRSFIVRRNALYRRQ